MSLKELQAFVQELEAKFTAHTEAAARLPSLAALNQPAAARPDPRHALGRIAVLCRQALADPHLPPLVHQYMLTIAQECMQVLKS
jgi:hypothetical protein